MRLGSETAEAWPDPPGGRVRGPGDEKLKWGRQQVAVRIGGAPVARTAERREIGRPSRAAARQPVNDGLVKPGPVVRPRSSRRTTWSPAFSIAISICLPLTNRSSCRTLKSINVI